MSGRTRHGRRALLAAALLLALGPGGATHAYLKFGTVVDGRAIELTWVGPAPVPYFIHDGDIPGLPADAFAAAVDNAFRTWEDVPTAAVRFERAGFTGASPLDQDGISTIGFDDRPEMDRTLAATTYLIDVRTGEILESDIFFNAAFPWTVAGSGEPGRYDVQSIATHEAGHFLGLGHSAVGETELEPGGGRRLIGAGAIMFPIAFGAGSILGRTLAADDVAGVSDMYPAGPFRRTTGAVQGVVTLDGRGVFGAHVVAYDMRTDELVGNFTLDDDGRFVVAGLAAGTFIIRAEPLDDGDLESFLDEPGRVETDFRATYYPRLVTVPPGGASVDITIEVVPK